MSIFPRSKGSNPKDYYDWNINGKVDSLKGSALQKIPII